MDVAAELAPAGLAPATLFLWALLCAGPMPLADSRRFRGRDDGVDFWCSFCWCRRSRSRRAKHLAHSGHSNGFSLVWERS